eukprot:CAMPEP_0196584564 /NCGR_PEP_ID=MMETSP1081-20130531/47585_1 /TAXON_ID=36882 /ORGANISM="Pyramimonas amylifera, Strain CCMP720" /LENGTH=224 /DNA_ID=CAMNT_0041905811 /DNA_START=117 /DNA_END=791 /DNA_ORIENTATION=-
MEDGSEVYGGDLPEEDLEFETQVIKTEDEESQELEAIKQRMQENEDELAKLRQLQSDLNKDSSPGQPATSEADNAAREEADSRSVYVGGVDYSSTPEDLQQLFQACGTVNRVTILSDKFENPKGFAYLEFLEAEAVQAACQLTGTELHGRAIKVSPKRTNVPGMKAFGRGGGRGRGRGRGGYGGFPGFGYGGFPMMMPMPMMFPGGGRGYRGRGRGRGRGYQPY